ncbi:hypothetical protein RND81_05G085600 [Saponaria officinalis]|uniref:Ubiquitin-like protease family profile domain-containing protein n=1 Tax=Saponaria officinalis TaxID=3572 RepID=A0AAW1KUJ3_SAPOF
MGEFLVENEVTKGAEIKDFELVNIPLSWQTFTHENLDCGVFTMFHMLFYCGSIFECHLANEDLRTLYRAEIAAILVLSDLNESRNDVLKTLEDFGIEKETTLASLVEKRKQAEQSGQSRRGIKRKDISKKKSRVFCGVQRWRRIISRPGRHAFYTSNFFDVSKSS